jgi:hypothetical protein
MPKASKQTSSEQGCSYFGSPLGQRRDRHGVARQPLVDTSLRGTEVEIPAPALPLPMKAAARRLRAPRRVRGAPIRVSL